MTGTLHNMFTFVIIFHKIHPRMRNVWDKRCKENKTRHSKSNIYIYIFFFFFENRVLYETMTRNTTE